MKASEIGQRFIDFFSARQHAVVPSASLIYNDPTLLFVNAGMVPFKPYFVGAEPSPFHRAVSMQKCVRTLDIEDVGKTTRHGTFFQMLGNFSFGDYFKKDAINWALELVTGPESEGNLGFSKADVWVTVLGPGYHPNYPHGDEEAKELWMAAGIPEDHIQPRNLKDNYWNMGVPGPGGPCSEIYIDRGSAYGKDGGPEADEDRFLEIWNLVFQTEDLSQVRAKDDFDIARQLPHQNIDTGAGLERIALLKQGVDNMYETDQVFPVIQRAAELSGHAYGDNQTDDIRLRVIGDHVRSSLMLMTDGVTPGNEARGYVLRRLLRRSIRSMRLLGYHKNCLPELLDVSRQAMNASYPEIDEQWDRVSALAEAEENSFAKTLSQGTVLFESAVKETKKQGLGILPGDKAFALHDTYGFPIDLTLEMASEQGLEVDQDAFRTLMAEQRSRAKADAKAKKGGLSSTEAYASLRESSETTFIGYTDLDAHTKIRGIIANGESVGYAQSGRIEIVLDETPFYAESGGQDSDQGILDTPAGQLKVLDVQRPVPGLIVHTVELENALSVGDFVDAHVDPDARRGACQAHSATHVLHAALRQLVGKNATQAGSYNKPGYLRFDYSATTPMSPALRQEIEQCCNEAIKADLEVTSSLMSLEEAKAMGAMAMFGEKYPPIVRVVEMGGPWSRELCGGTHVTHASQIGLMTLLAESSIGSGARRVEALVSTDAFDHLVAERALVNQLTDSLKVQPDQLPERVNALISELKAANKQINDLKLRALRSQIDSIIASGEDLNGIRFVAAILDDVAAGDLRTLVTDIRDRLAATPAVVALIARTPKPAFVVAVNDQARALGQKAGQLIREGAAIMGGKGGGKDDLAQGGAADVTKASDALQALRASING